MEKICQIHNLTLELVKEGISRKTSKKYNAFYSCPNRDCKYTENIPEKQGHFLSMQADYRRAKEIAYMNANNAAVEVMKMRKAENASVEDFQEGLTSWRDWFRKEWEAFYIREVINEEE